jgi:hypothetical protein
VNDNGARKDFARMPKQMSESQIAAARANGARSRGPVSPIGKARSSRNSTSHGLLARAILLDGESRARFDNLVQLLNEALKPESAIDHLLVGKMAASHWRQVRIWNLEREGEKGLGDIEMRLDRQFFRTLDRYLKLRAWTRNSFSEETNPTST